MIYNCGILQLMCAKLDYVSLRILKDQRGNQKRKSKNERQQNDQKDKLNTLHE
jgi:hypothetical protein